MTNLACLQPSLYFLPCPLQLFSFILDRVPGQIETLTDLLLEDFKSFGTCQELGEESVKFIRNELETTWGSSHLAVLDEQEAQKWLLGVGLTPLLNHPIIFLF